jgi:MYXO-CTERM domain-containing protein
MARADAGTATIRGAARLFGLGAALVSTTASAELVPISVAPSLSAQSTHQAAHSQSTRRIFVNFAGTELTLADPSSPDDATRNLTRMAALARPLVGYGGSTTERAAILQAVRSDWAAYDAVVTDRRPGSGDYVMNHVGPNRPDEMGAKVLGVAHLDCGDLMMRNDVSFAFHHADDGHEASSVAMTISQEVAHAFGLEHVDDPADIMFPARGVADPSFEDRCSPVVPADGIGIACTAQHLESCGDPHLQNSHAELMALLGPARVDDVPPTVAIAGEMEALAVMPGDSFRLAVEAEDDVLVDRVVLYVDGDRVAEDDRAPFGWRLDQVELGEYELVVEAFDMAGNRSLSAPVMLYVGMEPPEGVDAASPYASSDDFGGGADIGCACTSSPEAPAGPVQAAALMLLLAWRRRRA